MTRDDIADAEERINAEADEKIKEVLLKSKRHEGEVDEDYENRMAENVITIAKLKKEKNKEIAAAKKEAVKNELKKFLKEQKEISKKHNA